jgi:type I restriction enzyme R subunit
VLLVDREPVGVIEAKHGEKVRRITQKEAQAERYANAIQRWCKSRRPLRIHF